MLGRQAAAVTVRRAREPQSTPRVRGAGLTLLGIRRTQVPTARCLGARGAPGAVLITQTLRRDAALVDALRQPCARREQGRRRRGELTGLSGKPGPFAGTGATCRRSAVARTWQAVSRRLAERADRGATATASVCFTAVVAAVRRALLGGDAELSISAKPEAQASIGNARVAGEPPLAQARLAGPFVSPRNAGADTSEAPPGRRVALPRGSLRVAIERVAHVAGAACVDVRGADRTTRSVQIRAVPFGAVPRGEGISTRCSQGLRRCGDVRALRQSRIGEVSPAARPLNSLDARCSLGGIVGASSGSNGSEDAPGALARDHCSARRALLPAESAAFDFALTHGVRQRSAELGHENRRVRGWTAVLAELGPGRALVVGAGVRGRRRQGRRAGLQQNQGRGCQDCFRRQRVSSSRAGAARTEERRRQGAWCGS